MSEKTENLTFSAIQRLTMDIVFGTLNHINEVNEELVNNADAVRVPAYVKEVQKKVDQSNPVRKTQAA